MQRGDINRRDIRSFAMVDHHFFFPRTAVSIITVGDSDEVLLLRAILKSLSASVKLHLSGALEDIPARRKRPGQPPPYLSISSHGDEVAL